MIKSFRHKGPKSFFESGSKAGINPVHAPRLARQLARLDVVSESSGMNIPGWGLHALVGDFIGHTSVSVNGN